MAEKPSTLEKIGLTRGKAVLIGVLTIALGGVIYLQFGSEDVGELSTPRVGARRVPAEQGAAAGENPSASTGQLADEELQLALAELDQSRWQSPELTEVIAYDPFALPSAFPQPPAALLDQGIAGDNSDLSGAAARAQQLAEAVEQMQQQLAELQRRGVHVIVNRDDDYIAMVGDRTLRVGDEINGFTVTAIDPNGVRVERKGVE